MWWASLSQQPNSHPAAHLFQHYAPNRMERENKKNKTKSRMRKLMGGNKHRDISFPLLAKQT